MRWRSRQNPEGRRGGTARPRLSLAQFRQSLQLPRCGRFFFEAIDRRCIEDVSGLRLSGLLRVGNAEEAAATAAEATAAAAEATAAEATAAAAEATATAAAAEQAAAAEAAGAKSAADGLDRNHQVSHRIHAGLHLV
ncbi:MAG: hypothetical protein DWQ41_08625, partial [Planctomycetota bacterium]